MSSKVLTFRDCVSVKGRVGWKGLSVSEYVEDGPFIVTGPQIQNERINWAECSHVTIARYEESPEIMLQNGDILFTKDGTIGKIGIVSDLVGNATIASHIFLIRPSNGLIDNNFLYYYLQSHEIQWSIFARISGSVIPSITQKDFLDISVALPSIETQNTVGRYLRSIDDIMQINSLISEKIQNVMSSLFRSWFIDFDPVKAKADGKLPYGMDEETAALFADSFEDSELGKIPVGWEVKSLLEVSHLYDNLRIPLSSIQRNERKGIYPYHGATSVMDFVDDFIYDGVYVLIAEDGSVLDENGYPVLQYVWGKFWVNNHAHVLQGKSDLTTEHLHQYVKHFYIQPFVTGAVQLKINQKALRDMKLVIAPSNINTAFNKIIQPLYQSIRENKMKNEILTQTRDALLRRLMSEELEV